LPGLLKFTLTKKISKESYREQEKSDWCGVACVQMLLNDSGIPFSQQEIASEIYRPGWGTDEPEMKTYLRKKHFDVDSKEDCSLNELHSLINKGFRTIVYWLNDLPTIKGEEDVCGHYSILADIDLKNKQVLLMDPSRQIRLNDKNRIYWLAFEDFIKRWTVIEENKLVSTNWALWIKPTT
jgi:ABC-type bacteriocin/lantibiotic exporter with double-glycine peptidase domain